MTVALARYAESMAHAIGRCFAFRAAMTAPEWAETVRRMDGGRRYRFGFAPYQSEMMAAPFESGVQMTVFQLASRLGKTEVVMNIIGHSIDEAPRRILTLYPTTSQAEKWSKETLEKELFEPTPSLQGLVRGGRRDSSNTILHKLFPGGLINIFGGNAPGEMRRAKGNLLFADEIDALQEQKGDEGDQLDIFWLRGSEYSDAIKIAASYPSVTGSSRIARLMESSDFRKWHTPCIKCNEDYVMMREHIRHPAGEPEKAEIECPLCAGVYGDDERREMVMAGKWVASKPFAGIAGFFGNAMMSPHPVQKGYASHLHWLADQEEKAEKADNPDRARHVIANTIDAVTYTPARIEAPDPDSLLGRREDYKPREMLPDGVMVVTSGVDIQKRWIEAAVWGLGDNKESWLLEHRLINGAPDDPATWDGLQSFLASCRYPHPTCGMIELFEAGSKVMVDAGHWDNHVLPWTGSRQGLGVFAVQGSPTINAPVLGKKRMAPNRAGIYPIGVNQAKEIIYARLSLTPPPPGEPYPPGFIHLNDAATPTFVEGLTCEYGKEERFRGEMFVRYVCPHGARNEPLDTFVYAYAGERLVNCRYDRLRENLERKHKEQQAPATKRKRPKRKGFING